jgi:flagellar export protein FliJ
MKRFQFPLARVLAVRRAQANAELAHLERLQAQQSEREAEKESLARAAQANARALGERGATHPANHLQAVEQYAGFVRDESHRLSAAIVALQREIEDQTGRVREAEQRCRLLEKLETQQLAEWERAAAKELDELAADVFLAQWARSRTP